MAPAASTRRLITKRVRDRFEDLPHETWDSIRIRLSPSQFKTIKPRLKEANKAYTHAKTFFLHTISTSKANDEFNRWIKASGRLRTQLRFTPSSVPPKTKNQIVRALRRDAESGRFRRATPISFCVRMLTYATAGLNNVLKLNLAEKSAKAEDDLWYLWIQLLTIAFQEAGHTVTASSTGKSSFVDLVLDIQNSLPDHCHRFKTPESAAKGIQLSRKRFGKLETKQCLSRLRAARQFDVGVGVDAAKS